MSTKLFFSDCHISAGLGLVADGSNAHPWEWLTPSDNRRLQAFIAWVASRAAEVDEVVLVGDVFDNWIFPHDLEPPTLAAILQSANATPVVQALDRLSRAIPTTILSGNHDLTLTAADLARVLPKAKWGGNGGFATGKLRAEHGHAWGLFNAPDPLREDQLPLGYFISRMVATADRRTGNHTPSISQEIRELAEMIVAREELAQGVFDAVCAKAGVGEADAILMPDDLWGGRNTTVKAVRELYKDLYDEWKKRNGSAGAVIAISAELSSLSLIADRIQLGGGPRALIMGHTHEAASQQHTIPFLGNRIYANSGSWCHDTEYAAWVEAKDENGSLQLTVFGCKGFDASGKPQALTPLAGPVST